MQHTFYSVFPHFCMIFALCSFKPKLIFFFQIYFNKNSIVHFSNGLPMYFNKKWYELKNGRVKTEIFRETYGEET